ncbi:MAG: efflux RND transporter periplasmic adaptor subunit [Chitinophagaceae bacterium]|jgi:RND family efflux transporter MFP subunit
MKKLIIPIALFAAVLLNESCGTDKKETNFSEAPIQVQLSEAHHNINSQNVTASGKVEAENSANLSTRMMGYVTKVSVKVGDKVNAGQLLLSINNTDLLAKKAQVDASILQATAAYNNAKKDYDRFVNLFAQQSASQKELDDMTARFEMAKAALEGAKQMKNEVMAQFSYANITAPFSGVVTNTFVKEGDMANPGMPLISIEGASKLQVIAMVSESDISGIKTGMEVSVMVKTLDKVYKGTVIEASQSAKNTGGQYLVKIGMEKTEGVLSGMFVNVQFPIAAVSGDSQKESSLLIPETALVRQGQLVGVYTVGSNKEAILRWLRTGSKYGDQVEVLSGLSADESYILSANGKLYNGAKVSF